MINTKTIISTVKFIKNVLNIKDTVDMKKVVNSLDDLKLVYSKRDFKTYDDGKCFVVEVPFDSLNNLSKENSFLLMRELVFILTKCIYDRYEEYSNKSIHLFSVASIVTLLVFIDIKEYYKIVDTYKFFPLEKLAEHFNLEESKILIFESLSFKGDLT